LEDNKPESTHRGFMWVYRHPINNLLLFDCRKGKCKSGYKERLSSFKGIIWCDGAAEYALGEIANWYAEERKYRENGLNPQEKLLRRQEDIKPGFDTFKEWVETQHKNILTKGTIGKALHYGFKHLPMIDPFFEDGRIHLDNNAIENKLRSLALGRKNFLFTGSR